MSTGSTSDARDEAIRQLIEQQQQHSAFTASATTELQRLAADNEALRAELARVGTGLRQADTVRQSDSVQRSVPTLKLPTPATFSGDSIGPFALTDWAYEVQTYSKAMNLPIDQEFHLGVALLKGSAQAFWRNTVCTALGQSCGTFAQLLQLLSSEFANANALRTARDALHACVQGTGSARAYIAKFRTLCLRVTDLSDAEKMDKFERGLKLKHRQELARRPQPTFDAACAVIERMEAADSAVMPSTGAPQSAGSGPAPMDLNALVMRNGRFFALTPVDDVADDLADEDFAPATLNYVQTRSRQPAARPTASKQAPVLPKAVPAQSSKFKRLTDEERTALINSNGCFYCRTPNAGHTSATCPQKQGKALGGTSVPA